GYPISARALSPAVTLFLPIAEFDRLFSAHNEFRSVILNDLTARHRNAIQLLNIIALKPVLGRVATLIVRAAAEANALDGSAEFELTLKQEQLANEVATTREGVARSLARLRREGVIDQHGSSIRILDTEKLLSY
ncbi:MAG TPA: Crp/Fnr family transcriptional regulator, partial [Longimicrobiales bacterium]